MNSLYDFYKEEISGSHLFEWVIIILCFIILIFLEVILKKFSSISIKYIEHIKNKYPLANFNYRIISLISSIVVLTCGAFISYYFSGNYNNILKLIKVTTVLLIYTALDKFLKSNIHLRVVSLLISIPIIANTLGLLELIITDLDLVGFEIGKTNFTMLLFVKFIYIFSVIFWIGKYVSKLVESIIKKQPSWNITTKIFLLKFFNVFLFIILTIIGLNILGFDFTTLTLFSGAFVFALTLSMQKIASNFLSGMILLFEKAIKVNDVIEVHNGVKGIVKYLGARTTVIDAQDGSEITVPNEDIINSKIISWSGKKNQLVKVEFSIELYAENNPAEICQLFVESIKKHPECVAHPEVECKIENFIKNNIEYHITFWTSKEHKTKVRGEIMLKIWSIINEHGIKFAVYN